MSILAFLVALLWIGFGVYQLLHTSTIPEVQQKRLTLFSPELDERVVSELEERKQILGQQLDENARVVLFLSGETIETSSSP